MSLFYMIFFGGYGFELWSLMLNKFYGSSQTSRHCHQTLLKMFYETDSRIWIQILLQSLLSMPRFVRDQKSNGRAIIDCNQKTFVTNLWKPTPMPSRGYIFAQEVRRCFKSLLEARTCLSAILTQTPWN